MLLDIFVKLNNMSICIGQQIAPKKNYCIDTGLSNTVGFGFSPNTGKLMENLAFLALRQKTESIYYYLSPEGFEVDFYLPEQRRLIQVTQSLENPSVRERELRALESAAIQLKVERATILTHANEDMVMLGKLQVEIKSMAEWLLQA